MDCVPSFDVVSPLFLSDFIQEEDEMKFLNSFSFEDSSFSNLTTADTVISSGTTIDRKRKNPGRKVGDQSDGDHGDNKRIKHRDVERQRRQELANLLKSLRALLPLQYIKGKRAASDHIQESVNYIKDVQNRIKKLKEKRDEIKKSVLDVEEENNIIGGSSIPSSLTEECCSSSSSSSCSCPEDIIINSTTSTCVVVMPCLAGVEVLVTSCLRHKFCLSSVLQVLTQEEGFNIVKCLSTKVQGRFIHNIVSQVNEGRIINFTEIKEKIMKTNIR